MKRTSLQSKFTPRPAKQWDGPAPTPRKALLTQARLHQLLHYDPVTGAFTRRVGAGSQLAGSTAGATNADGYVQISIDRTLHYAHRLVWLYVHGHWPAEQIDHKDRIRDHNWLANLRLATNAENCQNASLSSNNKSGARGVSWFAQNGTWRATINTDGKQKSLGYFADIVDAIAARKAAEPQAHPFRFNPQPKENAIQSVAYMNLVRAMPCAHCNWPPRSQFCHSDAGKGQGLKTDCRRGWPGCGDDPKSGRVGCHTLIGASGHFTKNQRRALEDRYAAQTRAAVLAAGKWPAMLPRWPA